jgi:hypothetical protein
MIQRRRVQTRALCVVLGTFLLLGGGFLLISDAKAMKASGWAIRSIAEPTGFSSGHDRYVLLVTNVGDEPSDGQVVISDKLPTGVVPTEISGQNLNTNVGFACSSSPVECSDSEQVVAGDTLLVEIRVRIEKSVSGRVENLASVSGGGAPREATSEVTTIGEAPSLLRFEDFNLRLFGMSGGLDTLAGDRPDTLATSFDFNTFSPTSGTYIPTEEAKDIVVDLPLGVIGDPLAAPRCRLSALMSQSGVTTCPPASKIGTVVIEVSGGGFGASDNPVNKNATGLFNLVPEAGYPAEFGFTIFGLPVVLYASLAHTNAGYVLRTATPGAVEDKIAGVSLVLFGDPGRRDGEDAISNPFFTNPVDCSTGPLSATIRANSWQDPGRWVEATSTVYPRITECDVLQFLPSLHVRPETSQADEPSGYEVNIESPQNEQSLTAGTPELRDATVTLPAGVSISPSAADGLTGCEATGPSGIDMPSSEPLATERPPDEAGEGETIGPDGLAHLVAGHCSVASTIGTVEVTTPLLSSPLQGHIYLAQPRCGGQNELRCTQADASNGNLFGLYLEAAGSGVVLKLAGKASVDPTTGQLTASFVENPQLPFSDLKIKLNGGVRAPLANPQTCGTATASSDMRPWSSPVTPDATPLAQFGIDWNGAGEPCPASLPFALGFVAHTSIPTAGAFSPFALGVTRTDRMQNLSRLQVSLPAGLLGTIAGVTLCPEPQAAQGTCSAASEVGTTTVAVGAGSHPFWVTGRVYLTGPYEGAPFGLSVVVPAQAGPFNLGNVVVRARIDVDPHTAALTITSDPLPQIVDGVPLRVQTIDVTTANRPDFVFNPTECTQKAITGTVTGAQGASTAVSTAFAAADCKTLLFKPKFSVSTAAKTSKQKGASLDVKVTSGAGQANIASVVVSLPKQLPARLTTLQQACPEGTFAANPAACPAASDVGTAKAVTPVLNEPVTGPAYLVSHGGAAFPDLVVILQGQGIRLDLVGNTNIKKGITTSTFGSVPDAPISSFELKLPQGPHSVLSSNLPAKAKRSLCGTKLVMPTMIVGHNGAQVKQSTKIVVSGCAKKAAEAPGRKSGQ